MNEKRFERWNDYSCKVKDNQEETLLNREVQELNYRSQADDMCEVLNEKEAIIQRLEKENQLLEKNILKSIIQVFPVLKK